MQPAHPVGLQFFRNPVCKGILTLQAGAPLGAVGPLIGTRTAPVLLFAGRGPEDVSACGPGATGPFSIRFWAPPLPLERRFLRGPLPGRAS